MKTLTALSLFLFAVDAMAAGIEPAVPGYTPTLRLDAKDAGIILRHGDGPNQCDINGAREPTLIVEDGKYFLFYDGGGPKGWLACLATSTDLKTWTKHGAVLDFGKPGEPDAGSALSPWFVKEGDSWHMYYVTAEGTTGPPGFVSAGPYNSGHASSKSLMGPWVKTKGYIPVKPKPPGAGYPQTMAYPGHIVKKPDGEFLMFFGSPGAIGIARTRDLLGDWKPDAAPLFDKHFDLENSSVYFEPDNQTWFMFVNHIKPTSPMFTDATWVFWTKDLEKWDSENRAIALDGVNCTWSKRCIGMATVTKVGNRLAMVYDAAGGESIDNLGRDIGLAWYDLPLAPPMRPVYRLDLSGLNQLDLTNPTAARKAWDTLHAAASVQGIVNREGAVLFLRHMPETDDFWWDWLRAEGHWLHGRPVIELRDLADAVKTFAPKLKGVVLYDSQVAATALLASTIAGVENRMALRHDPAADAVSTQLAKLPEFPKDVVRLFQPDGTPLFTGKGKIPDTTLDSTGSAKNDAYLWAKARYLEAGKCSREFLAYYMDSHWLTNPAPPSQGPNQGLSNSTLANHDFFISQRAFFFDLGVWPEEAPVDDSGQKPGTDVVTLRAILRTMAECSAGDIFTVGGMVPWLWKYSGPLPGWAGSGGGHHPVHSEWEFARLISAYNGMMDADAMGGMANASFYQHYPLKDHYPQQRKPTMEDLQQRGLIRPDGTVRPNAYVALYMGDYDAASWFQQYIPKWWADPQHGKVTCNWAFNPILDRRAPHVVDYVRTQAAATDWFISGDSGMGYLNPGMLTAPRLDPSIGDGWDAWTKRNEASFRRYDLSIAGFVIEGFGPFMGKRGLDAYARFAPDGMMLQTSEPSLKLIALHEGKLPYIRHRMDLDGPPAQAAAALLAKVAEEKPHFADGPQFLVARSVLKSPTWHAETIAATQAAPGGERVTFLDARSFFLLMKKQLTAANPTEPAAK